MKKVILFSLVLTLVFLVAFHAKIADAILTAIVREKLSDHIPIESVSAHAEDSYLTVSGKLFGKAPVLAVFKYEISRNKISLMPQSASLYGKKLPLDRTLSYFGKDKITFELF